jgi:hypothetical protein
MSEKREVRIGSGRHALDKPMTREQARRYGEANMPKDLRQAGFETVVFVSDPEINDATFFRINYGMRCAQHT